MWLIFILLITPCYGFVITETCKAEYNLLFKLEGYTCTFSGTGVYTYNGKPVDFVRFNRITLESFIYLDAPVKSVKINVGSPKMCGNVILGRGSVEKIVVGGYECVSTKSSPSFDTTSSTTISTLTSIAPVKSTPPTLTSTAIPKLQVQDVQMSAEYWFMTATGFVVSLLDMFNVLAVVVISFVGLAYRFYNELLAIFNPIVQQQAPPPVQPQAPPPPMQQQANPPPVQQQAPPPPVQQQAPPLPVQQQANPPPVRQQAPPLPVPQQANPPPVRHIRPKRNVHPPNRYGDWASS